MSINKQTHSGFTEETTKNLLLDAGAIYVNFDPEVDTPQNAKAKLIGATSGGNSFAAVPTYRQVAVDGVKGRAKGLSILQSWEVTMGVKLLEFKEDTYKYALGAVTSEDVTFTEDNYKEIRAKNYIEDADYLENITYVGTISGSNKPVMIQIYNALNMGGLSVEHTDGTDIVAELTFTGHYGANDLNSPPFRILYPVANVTEPETEVVEG